MNEPVAVNDRELRRLVHLVRTLVALAVLFLLGVGGLGLAARKQLELVLGRGSPEGASREAFTDAQRSAQELASRQDALAFEVGRVAGETRARINVLRAQRSALGDAGGGPIAKLDTTLAMTELMSDQVFVMMENVTGMKQALTMAARPLPIERSATATPPPNAIATAQDDREQRANDRKEAAGLDAGHPDPTAPAADGR